MFENLQDERGFFRLWTAQTKPVLDCILKEGRAVAKTAYVDQKYQEAAWVFQEAYGFFRKALAERLPAPEGAETPYWLQCSERFVFQGAGSWLLELAVPQERVLLFEREKWEKVLNLSYIGKDAAEEAAFSEELLRAGLSTSFEAFATPFYPMQKQKIKKSWERLFERTAEEPDKLAAAVWEIRKEDLVRYQEAG